MATDNSDLVDESLSDVVNYLKKEVKQGIAINAILVWIDIQQRTTPKNVWFAQALSAFGDGEVETARSVLWRAASSKKDIIGDIVAHRSPGKTNKNLEDIHKAMTDLRDNNALPMLLCSNDMVREFPAFHCDKEKMDITDVISKMKVVEDSLNSFIKQNNDQMRELTSSVAKATISAPREVLLLGVMRILKPLVPKKEEWLMLRNLLLELLLCKIISELVQLSLMW